MDDTSNIVTSQQSIDCERWLNELTHKYLEYVKKSHLHGFDPYNAIGFDLRSLFDRLQFGDKDLAWIGGVQKKRQINHKYLDEKSLREFDRLLHSAVIELEKFLTQ